MTTVTEAYVAWTEAARRHGHKLDNSTNPVVAVDTLECIHSLQSKRSDRCFFELLLITAVPRGHVLIAAGTFGGAPAAVPTSCSCRCR